MSGDETTSSRPGRVGALLPYILAAMLAVVLVTVTLTRSQPSAAADALGGQQLKIMAPADPGGGWDGTARQMQGALQDIIGRTSVYNVGGGGGTIGLSQFEQLDGQRNQLMVMGLVMVGAIAANDPTVTLQDVTPIASLTTEPQLIVVPADSEIADLDDFLAALEDNVGEVSWAGGSAGGAEQILAGLMAQDLGVDPVNVNYIAHAGGGEAIATLLSGSATAGVSSVSEFLPLIESGKVRPIGVSSEERVANLPDTPTLREGGVDVVLSNWRGVVAPPGLTDDEVEALVDLVDQMSKTPEWETALEQEGWESDVRLGDDFATYLDSEITRVEKVIADLGIGQGS